MCSCHERNKQLSANGGYYGRAVKSTSRKFGNTVSTQEMVKKLSQPNKKSGKS
jgi:hypothetical protein